LAKLEAETNPDRYGHEWFEDEVLCTKFPLGLFCAMNLDFFLYTDLSDHTEGLESLFSQMANINGAADFFGSDPHCTLPWQVEFSEPILPHLDYYLNIYKEVRKYNLYVHSQLEQLSEYLTTLS